MKSRRRTNEDNKTFMKKLRWGILSTANIARKNWSAILHSGNSVVAAVASRDVERSRQFISECQREGAFGTAPVALGSYEELIASKDVDAVYVPLPTGLRKEWVLRAAAAGKHVLCEKPCGINEDDVREMADACHKHRVQFMDGVMFMHNPRLDRVREILEDGTSVGQIRRMMSIFCFRMGEDVFDSNVRVHSQLEPAGSLGDLGWYCIRFALWAMHWRLPREVSGRVLSSGGSTRSHSPVPIDFSGEMVFDAETSVGFFSSFQTEYQQWFNVAGTKGYLHIPDFVHPLSQEEPFFQVNAGNITVKCASTGTSTGVRYASQEANMIRNFVNQVQSGKLNDDWPQIALKTQQVMDACLKSARDQSRSIALS